MKFFKKQQDELLPCPFCGEHPVIDTLNKATVAETWKVCCCNGHSVSSSTRQFAIQSWNQRHSPIRRLIKYPILQRDLRFAGRLGVVLLLLAIFWILIIFSYIFVATFFNFYSTDFFQLTGMLRAVFCL